MFVTEEYIKKKNNDNGKVKSEKLLGLFVRVSKVEIFEMLPWGNFKIRPDTEQKNKRHNHKRRLKKQMQTHLNIF